MYRKEESTPIPAESFELPFEGKLSNVVYLKKIGEKRLENNSNILKETYPILTS